jgi:hypothetical protein
MKFREENEFELITFLANTKFILRMLSCLEARWMKRVNELLHVNRRNANHRRFLPHFRENFHRYFDEECCLWDSAQRFIPFSRKTQPDDVYQCSALHKERFLRKLSSQLHILRLGRSGVPKVVYSNAWLPRLPASTNVRRG